MNVEEEYSYLLEGGRVRAEVRLGGTIIAYGGGANKSPPPASIN